MQHRCCANCLYATCSTHAQFCGFLSGFGVRPTCSNHPDSGDRLREVMAGSLCRNYRPKPLDEPTGALRRLSLANGQFVLVDAADYEWLSRYRWTMHGGGYAARREKGRTIFMHREIMHAPPGRVVDHSDGCRQNNYRSNLRVCTRQENIQNRPKRCDSGSRFKGVVFHKLRRKWFGQAYREGEHFRTPLFADEADAARAYDRLAVELFGLFADVNFPEDWPPERRAEVFAKREMVQALRNRRAERAQKQKGKGKKAKGKSERAKAQGKGQKGKTKK